MKCNENKSGKNRNDIENEIDIYTNLYLKKKINNILLLMIMSVVAMITVLLFTPDLVSSTHKIFNIPSDFVYKIIAFINYLIIFSVVAGVYFSLYQLNKKKKEMYGED